MKASQLEKSKQMLEIRKTLTKEELAENFRGWRYRIRVPTPDELRDYSDFVEKVIKKRK